MNKGERKDSAMPTLDKAKAWWGEGHEKARVWAKKKALCWGLSYFTLATVKIVGGSPCSKTGLNLCLAASASSPASSGWLSFPWKQLKLLLARPAPVAASVSAGCARSWRPS